jgi:hypothetical protein
MFVYRDLGKGTEIIAVDMREGCAEGGYQGYSDQKGQTSLRIPK